MLILVMVSQVWTYVRTWLPRCVYMSELTKLCLEIRVVYCVGFGCRKLLQIKQLESPPKHTGSW
jgi:hypothetical protein